MRNGAQAGSMPEIQKGARGKYAAAATLRAQEQEERRKMPARFGRGKSKEPAGRHRGRYTGKFEEKADGAGEGFGFD